jgi:anthranilate synthase component 2
VIAREGLPEELDVTSTAAGDVIMGVRHRRHPVEGIQFHPESVLTPSGSRIVENWLGIGEHAR